MVWRKDKMLDPVRLKVVIRVGDTILLPDGCATEKAPKEVRQATKLWFNRQRVLQQVEKMQQVQAEIRNLGGVVQDAMKARDAANNQAAALKVENAKLSERIVLAEREAKVANGRNPWWSFALGGVLGIIVAGGGVWLIRVQGLTRGLRTLTEEKLRNVQQERLTLAEEAERYQHALEVAERDQRGLADEAVRYQEELQAVQQELQSLKDRMAANLATMTPPKVSTLIYYGDVLEFKIMKTLVKCPCKN
jgi:predicted nuclease with TOPRIM domain